jgi:hypothetical protein
MAMGAMVVTATEAMVMEAMVMEAMGMATVQRRCVPSASAP